VAVIRDITEQKHIQDELLYLVKHDALTQLPNRYFLEETITKIISGQSPRGSLLLVDIDNFKLINDTLGHLSGDKMLIKTAAILQQHLPKGSFLARIDSDEFAVLLSGVELEAAMAAAEKLRTAVETAKLYPAAGSAPFTISISVGIAPLERGATAGDILSHADYLLYRAKQQGRNLVVAPGYGSDIKDRLDESIRLLQSIQDALAEGRMVLYFQPVVNAYSQQIIHHEGLLRIAEKNGIVQLPGSFIPVAEQFGLMSLIDRQVIQLAFAALVQYPDLRLFVNLSGVSVGDTALLNLIEENIKVKGIDPKRLGFEITETMAIRDIPQAERWLRKLKAVGCQFALDDFGIGFSSFSYLQQLPVDFVKIDGSFVRDLDCNERHRVLVQAIHSVASSLGKVTIAEFVENDAIASILSGYQISNLQGYYLGRPEPVPQSLDKVLK
jgi:diguanylate cyclase (GGDEF)-like protein